MASQKAKEAVAKSTVKLEVPAIIPLVVEQSDGGLQGKDVMATWKILISLVFVPCLHLFYTACVYLILGVHTANS